MSMGGHGSGGIFRDKVASFCLLVLAVFGIVRLVTAGPTSFLTPEPTLANCYFTFANTSVAALFYVPLFALCVSRLLGRLAFAPWLTRHSGRVRALASRLPGLVTRAALFSALVLGFSLAALLLRSGVAFAVGEIVAFAALQLLYGALFFVLEGLVILVVQLLCGSSVFGMAAAIVYGAIDSLVVALDVWSVRTPLMGWTLVSAADPATPVLALTGGLRLLCLVALLGIAGAWLVRRVDFTEEQ